MTINLSCPCSYQALFKSISFTVYVCEIKVAALLKTIWGQRAGLRIVDRKYLVVKVRNIRHGVSKRVVRWLHTARLMGGHP
jgi:hypothetical protein